MKHILIAFFTLIVTSSYAHIEYVKGDEVQPTRQEINRSRACFESLEKFGCGNPAEDYNRFRICLHEAFPNLNTRCKRMMSHLYSN